MSSGTRLHGFDLQNMPLNNGGTLGMLRNFSVLSLFTIYGGGKYRYLLPRIFMGI